MIQLGFN